MSDKSDKLKKMFENIEDINPEKMQDLVNESIKVFEGIIPKLLSTDEEERMKAMKEANELKDVLETQAKQALEKSGMNKDQIDKFMKDPANFSQKEIQALNSAKKTLDVYKNELQKQGVIDEDKQKKNKDGKGNLGGGGIKA